MREKIIYKLFMQNINNVKKEKGNLLDIFVKARTGKALDRFAGKSRDYQHTLKQEDKAFEALHQAGLDKKQRILIDRAVAASNACGAAYSIAAYRMGLQDGIKLMMELHTAMQDCF